MELQLYVFLREIYHKSSSMLTFYVLILVKITVTFVLSMTSIAYQSSVNIFLCYFLYNFLVHLHVLTGKNNGFPFLDILGYNLQNTHKNPKFGQVRQVPTREFPTKFPDCRTCLTLPNLGYFWVFFKYRKISKNRSVIFSCDCMKCYSPHDY